MVSYSLEEKAKKAGGYVHTILGNRDIMNMSGTTGMCRRNILLPRKYWVGSMGKCLTGPPNWVAGSAVKILLKESALIYFVHGSLSPEMKQFKNIAEINSARAVL